MEKLNENFLLAYSFQINFPNNYICVKNWGRGARAFQSTTGKFF